VSARGATVAGVNDQLASPAFFALAVFFVALGFFPDFFAVAIEPRSSRIRRVTATLAAKIAYAAIR
jgi:hypothetical protein